MTLSIALQDRRLMLLAIHVFGFGCRGATTLCARHSLFHCFLAYSFSLFHRPRPCTTFVSCFGLHCIFFCKRSPLLRSYRVMQVLWPLIRNFFLKLHQTSLSGFSSIGSRRVLLTFTTLFMLSFKVQLPGFS